MAYSGVYIYSIGEFPYLRAIRERSSEVDPEPLNLDSIRNNEPSRSADKVGQLTQLTQLMYTSGPPLDSTISSNPATEHQGAGQTPPTPALQWSGTFFLVRY